MKPSLYQMGRFLLRGADEQQAINARPPTAETVKAIRQPSAFFREISSDYLLAADASTDVSCDPQSLRRLLLVARETQAGIIYPDFLTATGDRLVPRPLNDYQEGSLRDDFNFGPFFILSTAAAKTALKKYGRLPRDASAAFYDLRLKISLDAAILHLPEFLYTACVKKQETASAEKAEAHFDYVAKENFIRQKEFEKIATRHLKRIGGYLAARTQKPERFDADFTAQASIVIPVLNRKKTIADALTSALTQKTNFAFNVIVVDNHSTDGTTGILKKFAAKYPHVHHLIPARRDLGIGGCWNEAIDSPHCGRYVVQLDSDDLYSSPHTLQKILDTLRQGRYAMVVGSYTLVNDVLKPILPGLIDHREWTHQNGHNNLLRVNGMGAPRAFDAAVIRRIGFPNVSYGEDYAVALRLSREYKIGRIYESLYLCRRWADNTDAGLSVEKQNRNDNYKDHLRSMEIRARQLLNAGERSVRHESIKKDIEHRHSRKYPDHLKVARGHECGNPETFKTEFQTAHRLTARTDGRNIPLEPLSPGRVFAEFTGKDDTTLPELCRNFYNSQKKSWPALAAACRDLTLVQERELSCGTYKIILQYNPARAASSGAAVDQESIKKRPCFLCAANRPAQQSAILYRNDYLVLCNPAPIFKRHFTIVARKHQPQEISSSLESLLQIASDASPDYTVFYNGPACGASAPDHLHFQMMPFHSLPFLNRLQGMRTLKEISSVRYNLAEGSDRSAIVLESKNSDALKKQFLHLLRCAGQIQATADEPLINVLCSCRKNCWQLMIFLRQKHRPDAYFAEKNANIFVSPGAVDMAGVVITPKLADYQRLDCDTLRNIYREVSQDEETLRAIVNKWLSTDSQTGYRPAPV
jgi:glycosyltransferase involved in cell wall biosynthesis